MSKQDKRSVDRRDFMMRSGTAALTVGMIGAGHVEYVLGQTPMSRQEPAKNN